ncbi:hypothetical protein SAMN02910292_02549 [Lachnospiraceae bacterium XBB2008]|nr:hypothetical protein SAMN02910292_02549 [Lachnospiraceae bacterium XBB2008]
MVTYEDALKIVMNSFSKNHIIYGFADYSDENKYVFSVKQKNCDGLMDSTVDMVVDKETGETETTRSYFDIIRLLFPEREKEIKKNI